MNSNVKTYVLLVVVLIIWGIVGYNIYSSLSGTPTGFNTNGENLSPSFRRKDLKVSREYTIHRYDRDPFLGTIKTKEDPKPLQRRKPRVVEAEPEIIVEYAGMVKPGVSKGDIIYFVRINSQRHLMHVGDEVSNVKLLKGNENEIAIAINGKQRKVKK
ncbi:hypothetical protein HX109_10970 [Galbibacter sp. BG1]|uniref:hypothetical protein n=1 Tax=Galbibacter sp. BG1 TaxID=1170699 RepID=UPI0015BBB95E|nr:hypothetical protein [Galbibacter sp. BG1]QLE02050.1 hypothetical protein HX109_10970 [Galbibacter sp. BG1]